MHSPATVLEPSSRSTLMTGALALSLLLLAIGSGTSSLKFDDVDCPHPSPLYASGHGLNKDQGIESKMVEDRSLLRVQCDGEFGKLRGTSALLFGRRLDINRASLSELGAVPGLSKTVAQEIIRQRNKNKYNNISELSRIAGVGTKTVLRLKRYLQCQP